MMDKAPLETPSPQVLLIANYLPDRQESMQRFAALLEAELQRAGLAVEVIRPAVYCGGGRWLGPRWDKWLGYIDKFVLFPLRLRRRTRQLRRQGRVIAHICDHGNALYAFSTGIPTVVTCHDMLAVRGALGEETDCPASGFGYWLQRMILGGLRRAAYVVCDSTATRDDLIRLAGGSAAAKSRVVLLGQNHQYRRLPLVEAAPLLATVPGLDSARPFLLTVGSNLLRKNRHGMLRIVASIAAEWPGQMVFAGEALDASALALAESLGIRDRIVQAVRPTEAALEALYSTAEAMLFPSKFEGFGWPIIEAQACGCPVLCSDRTSLPEVAGEGAVVCALDDEPAFGRAVLSLQEGAVRERLVERGYANLARFEVSRMVEDYRQVYLSL